MMEANPHPAAAAHSATLPSEPLHPETLQPSAADPNRQTEFLDEIDPADLEPAPFRAADPKRIWTAIVILLALLGLALGPPLVNVSRYRREIAASIGASLGRPVRMDSVSLNLLPMPAFTLGNLVVGEDPAFGAEPILRAGQVRATLRLSSLWRHKIEFSTITLEDASVNLVHLPDGRWNLEGVLLQASRVPAAPTQQKKASDAPRFPYIEATGARLNLKEGLVKMPLSLTEARFALWLPEPDQWHLRLEGHPNRTDVAATDTGAFHMEGTLARAARLEDVPVDLDATWSKAPLGGVSWVVLGRDAGLRGDLSLHLTVKGTVGANNLASQLELRQLRRADFVPAHALDADIACTAAALDDLHRIDQIACRWPPTAGPFEANTANPGLTLTGALPELLRPASVDLHATWSGVPAQSLLNALSIVSQRVSPNLSAAGTFSGDTFCCATRQPADTSSFAFTITGARLALGDAPPILDQTISAQVAPNQASADDARITTEPLQLDLGGDTPAQLTADAGWTGLHLHLTGSAQRDRLLALAAAVPQFGDGLSAILPPADSDDPAQILHLDADAQRPWSNFQFGPQVWTNAIPTKPVPDPAKPPRRHPRTR